MAHLLFPKLLTALSLLMWKVVLASNELHSPALSSCSMHRRDGEWVLVEQPEDALPILSWLKSLIPISNSNATIGHPAKSEPMLAKAVFDVYYDFQPTQVEHAAKRLTWMRYGSIYDNRLAGWLVGQLNTTNGISGSNIVFLYPDAFTAVIGNFDQEQLLEGVESRVKAFRCSGGVMELRTAKVKQQQRRSVRFESGSPTFVTSFPLHRDFYERRYLFVANTTLDFEGQGLFAKRRLQANQLAALYAGFQVHDTRAIFLDNMTTVEEDLVHMNLMSFDSNYSLNLPPPHDQLHVYRATLAHKTNHKFEGTNVKFDYFRSPRFGYIRCLRTSRMIEKGEELFVDYNYSLNSDLPEWYEQLYESLYGPINVSEQ